MADDHDPRRTDAQTRPDTAPIEAVGARAGAASDGPRSRHTVPFESLTPEQVAAMRGGTRPLGGWEGEPLADPPPSRIETTMAFDENDPIERTDAFIEISADMHGFPSEAPAGMPRPDDPAVDITSDLGVRHEEETRKVSTVDYALEIMDSVDMALPFGPSTTIDYADSLDMSLDRAIDDVPPLENPTDVDFPRPDTRPLGNLTPAEWAAHVLRACISLAETHDVRRTFEGQFDFDEKGVVGEARPAEAGTDGFALDVRRMHHLVQVIADAVRAGSDHSPAAVVVADALSELQPRDDARGLARSLRRAIEARARKQRKRLDAEFEAVDARARALSTQRRLRADLAARLARLDASIAAQAAAVARDEDRTVMLHAERKALGSLGVLIDDIDGLGSSLDEGAGNRPGPGAASKQVSPEDAVRRLLAVGGTVS